MKRPQPATPLQGQDIALSAVASLVIKFCMESLKSPAGMMHIAKHPPTMTQPLQKRDSQICRWSRENRGRRDPNEHHENDACEQYHYLKVISRLSLTYCSPCQDLVNSASHYGGNFGVVTGTFGIGDE